VTKVFPLDVIKGTPDQRRELLLAIKRAAKKDSFKVKVWWDRAGLHVEGPKLFVDRVASKMPKGKPLAK
jgi:hypothetical protein